ncbi:MAG TPA: GTP-binding protein [Methanosarcinaceae archaeon]|nr:GTP-binding protein [Methanosarcinaceae archaeon]
MIQTGITKLDDYLMGGIPDGKSLVYYSHPGVEGNVFGMQTLYHNLAEGKKCVFVASSSDPSMIKDMFKEFGWDLDAYDENLIVVDAYSGLVGATSNEKYVVENPESIDLLNESIEKVMEELDENSTIMFESLSTIMDLCGEKETIDAVKNWNLHGMLYEHVLIYNFTAWPYDSKTLDLIKHELFDAVITVGGIAERVIYGQYFGVLKTEWSDIELKSMLFRVLRPGGIRIYIPKIVVTGPYNAGKSTFVHALSTRAVSVDRIGTTVALDHGHVDHKGFSADIFGTPGQERFDPIIKMLSGEAMGIFLVVDSTNTKDFVRAKQMLEITKAYGLPLVVIANKQDQSGALKPEEIRSHFNIPENVQIMPTVADKGEGVFEAFEALVNKITEVV